MVAALTGCSSDSPPRGDSGSGTGATEAAIIPPIDADCDEIEAAITRFGEEDVFRAQYDDFLTVNGREPEDAPPKVQDSAVLAIRTLWSMCAFEIPQFADELAAVSPLEKESVKAQATREVLKSQDIHVFDQATDSGIDILGNTLCSLAEPLQPLSTPDIVGIAEDMVERFGRMTTEDAGKVFFIVAATYCPDLDMSG